MADRHVEVTRRSYGERLRGSFGGIVAGLLIGAIGIVLLFWNEGRAVRRAKALKEGASSVISVAADAPQAANEGRLVHLTGRAEVFGTLEDPLFGIETDAIRLYRTVEMYQWAENRRSEEQKKLGGGTETVTTYEYEPRWSERPIDSGGFEVPEGHENPPFPFESETWTQEPVAIGDFLLTDAFASKLTRREPLTVGLEEVSGSDYARRGSIRPHDGGFYLGENPLAPEIGDLRVRFEVTPPEVVSVVGKQAGGGLVPYATRAGGSLALVSYGALPASAMFEAAERGNTALTWVLRFVGWLLLFLGSRQVLRPLSVLADVVPAIGNLVGRGTTAVAFVLASLVALVVVAVGWLFYRPLLGIALLAAAAALLVWLVRRSRRPVAVAAPATAAPGRAAPPPPPPPPPG